MNDSPDQKTWFPTEDAGEAEMERFEALCRRCSFRVRRLLWREEPEVILVEAHYQLLLLLLEFDAGRGVPLDAFLAQMLPQRMLNWAQKKRQLWSREKQVEWDEDNTETDDSCVLRCEDRHAASMVEADCDAAAWWQDACTLLTARQRQVMEAVLQGHTEREIAAQLDVSCAAVHRVKTQAQKKLEREWKKTEKDG